MQRRSSFAWALVLVSLAVLGGSALFLRAQRAGPQRPLRIVVAGPAWTLDPQRHGDELTRAILGHFYEPLVDFDPDLALRPRLAVAWTNPSETEWRFQLREGVLFHDGRPFGAEDVKVTLDRARRLAEGFITESDIHAISDVRVVDDRTVVVETTRPRPLLLARLTGVLVLPRDTPDSEVWRPVGTGPWVFTGGTTGPGGAPVEGRRFEQYWGRKPDAHEFRIETIADEASRAKAALSGADVTCALPLTALDAGGKPLGAFRVVRRPTLTVAFLAFRIPPNPRIGRTPFQDVRVRRAVSLTLDRELLVREALGGQGKPLWQLAPPGTVGHDPALDRGEPDLPGARRLLAEAGFPGGFESTLLVDADRAHVAREIARQLAVVGIRLGVEAQPWDEVFRRMLFGLAPAALSSTNVATGHVSSLYESFLHSAGPDSIFGAENSARFSDPEVDGMVERAAASVPAGLREELLAAVRDRALRDLPYVPLYSPDALYGVRTGIAFTPRLDRAVFATDLRRASR
ncbi:MAG: ABC transporter substrate-binding protein [Thermoanaerobaculia bacterium]